MKFTELGLDEPIVRAVTDKGYTEATAIQARAIPVALEGTDILGTAQTGTGKTCAFALPVLQILNEMGTRFTPGRNPRALVLAPTRELAQQIFDSFVAYGKHLKLRHAVVFGGVNQRKQVAAIRAGIDVLIATPGRLMDLCDQGKVDLREVELLVLDEADRMLDMGFIHDMRKIVAMVREDRQTLLFSATVSKEIRALADTMLTEPELIETAPEATTVDAIAQRIYTLDREHKKTLLMRILEREEIERMLVFSKTKHGADKIAKHLDREGVGARAIHGDKNQNARTKAMKDFKSGKVRVLVATDIAARGIDVSNITHVINFDMPLDPETYVHRIGRTARAGTSGIAISMCDRAEIGLYRQIEKRSRIEIPVGDDHDDLTFEAPARRTGGNGGGGGGGKKPRRFNKPRGPRRNSESGGGGKPGGARRGPRNESHRDSENPSSHKKPFAKKKPKSKNAKRSDRMNASRPGKPGGKPGGKRPMNKKR